MTAQTAVESKGGKLERGDVVRQTASYVFLTYVSQALAILAGFATKRILGPRSFGEWALVYSLMSYAALLEFGVTQAATKEIAYLRARGLHRIASQYRTALFAMVAVAGIAGGAILLWSSRFYWRQGSETMRYGLAAVGLLLPAYLVQTAQVAVCWAEKRFGIVSRMAVWESFVALTLGVLFVWRLGFAGQVVTFAVIVLTKIGIVAWISRRDLRLKIEWGWRWMRAKRLLAVGVPLQLIALSNLLKATGATVLIAYLYGVRDVGLWALALSVQTYVYWTPNALSIVLFPRLQEQFAASRNREAALWEYLRQPWLALSLFVLPILVGSAYFLAPLAIRQVMPAFIEAVPITKSLLLGTWWLSLEHMPLQVLTTANRLWGRLLAQLLGGAGLGVCLAVSVVAKGGIQGIAVGTSIANIVAFVLIGGFASHVAGGLRGARRTWYGMCLAFGYFVAVILTLDFVVPDATGSVGMDVTRTALKCVLCVLLETPLFVLAERRLHVVEAMRSAVKRGLRG